MSGAAEASAASIPDLATAALDRYDLRARVSAELTAFLARQEVLLAEVSADLAPVVAALREFLDGGKRMRPAFCYWGWRAAGGGADAHGSSFDTDSGSGAG